MKRTNLFIRTSLIFIVSGAALGLSGCKKKFDPAFAKAQAAFNEKNYTEAADDVNEALTRWKKSDGNEKKARAYQLLGQSYRGQFKNDRAIDAFQEAIKLSSTTFDSAYQLGSILLTSNRFPEAADAFQDALKKRPDEPQALLGLGNAYYGLHQYNDAQLEYQRILDVSPGVREALENLKLVDQSLKPAAHKASLRVHPKPTHGAIQAPKSTASGLHKKKKKKHLH